jgi:pseudouridine-5'-phosphate glycosidase
MRANDNLGLASGIVVANPLPPQLQLDPALHDATLQAGLAAASAEGVSGKDVTPFLLDFFHTATGGKSLDVNVTIVLRNATLAAHIAAAFSAL